MTYHLGLLVVAASLFLASTVLPAQATAGPPSAEESNNRALISRSFDAWRDGTGGPYDLLAEDAVWTITGNSLAAKTYPSREAFMSEVIRPFNARMRTRLVPTMRHLYAEGNTVIAFFDAKGETRDGQTYVNTYAWFLEMKDGRIVRAHAFFDSNAFDAFWRRVTPEAK
ncbi:nuclear transport factor 2 family protein [Bradyrhizobium lablabi]|uniref:nuclear transport factor 2 family protein n=1 Tax=Bradyrhizobium lablabi TaxID=722472 RepID=UPI001BAD941F|nr:nuclear transport factor 2 family protein [Bradyrhizobium lablabi]